MAQWGVVVVRMSRSNGEDVNPTSDDSWVRIEGTYGKDITPLVMLGML